MYFKSPRHRILPKLQNKSNSERRTGSETKNKNMIKQNKKSVSRRLSWKTEKNPIPNIKKSKSNLSAPGTPSKEHDNMDIPGRLGLNEFL